MWSGLDPPWRACLELAWEAYGANTIPVGAVVTDASGEIVSVGRNRVYETHAHGNEIANSMLAHAEVNALLALTPDRYYDDHVLYTTLEPCALCVGATALATVGTLRYAGRDPYGGGNALGTNPQLSRAPLNIEGPLDNEIGRFAAALLPAYYLRFKPGGNVLRAYDAPVLEHARRLLDAGAPEAAAAGTSLEAFVTSMPARARPASRRLCP